MSVSVSPYRVPPPVVLRVLWRAQGGLCAGCGGALSRYDRSLDHVVPRSRSGADALGNVVLMHGRCNSRKGARMPTGCELVWLMAVNARLGVGPAGFRARAAGRAA